ncbi:FRG domain protein [compost metagenome]
MTNAERLRDEIARYQQFSVMGHLEHSTSGFDLLYLMQHHGALTRLLDWSESFNTALFFAFINWNPTETARVWMLDPFLLNTRSMKERTLIINHENFYENYNITSIKDNNITGLRIETVALYPSRNNKRMIAQQGVFTLQGLSEKPLEEQFNGQLVNEKILIPIELRPSVYEDVITHLKAAGVTYHSLFPDLDGLAKYVNDPYYLNKIKIKNKLKVGSL